jgi:hypothetical protein
VDFRVSDQPRDIGAPFISSATLSMRHGQSRSAMALWGATRLSCAGCDTSAFLVAVSQHEGPGSSSTPDP